jgi:anti-anti-sigma factor
VNAFEVTTVVRGGAVHLLLAGELDLAGAPVLAGALADAGATGLAVVIDCDRLTFLDASGVGALLVGARSCRAAHVVGARGIVRRVLGLVGFPGFGIATAA